MYIIIIGGGRVGYNLARALLDENQEVLIIDKDATTCERINSELGGVCIRGDGCEVATLIEAGTSRADIFIATTGDDEDNLVACQVARHKFRVPRTIAHVRNARNEAVFHRLGVDVTVNTAGVFLERITRELPVYLARFLANLKEQGVEIVERRIPPASGLIGRRVGDLDLPPGSAAALILRRGEKPLVPTADTSLLANDQILIFTPANSEDRLADLSARPEMPRDRAGD